MNEAAALELAEIAVESDLAAEEMAEISLQRLAFHRNVRVGRARRWLMAIIACIRLGLLLVLAFGENQQTPKNGQQRHRPSREADVVGPITASTILKQATYQLIGAGEGLMGEQTTDQHTCCIDLRGHAIAPDLFLPRFAPFSP